MNPRSVDPRQLRVAECVRLLNSTPLGEVVQPQVVYRHLGRTGFRISSQNDQRRIDLVRYAAWLFHERHSKISEGEAGGMGDQLRGDDLPAV